MYQITDIIVYPVKGLAGISLPMAKVLTEGLALDRRWMIVDESGLFLSQRNTPALTGIGISISEDGIHLKVGAESFSFAEGDWVEPAKRVTVWDDDVWAYEVDPRISEALSQLLGKVCTLVAMPAPKSRLRQPSTMQEQISVSFADGYPYLILGTASLDFLNEKLAEPISANRFRPNIIIQTQMPHEEDEWLEIRMGDVRLQNIKPSVRCQVINIDQQSGLSSKEPTKTLATYRKFGNQIQFGTNMIALELGEIKVGMEVKIY